jgi:Na+-translocating ferredoxin:NAD+ oxidoreductase RnfE subunit
MQNSTEKNGVLNSILSALIVGLDLILALMFLGFLIGLYELLK